MKLKLNREFFFRHFFVVLLLVGLGGWFAWDGLVRYPSLSAEALYRECHKNEAPPSLEKAEAFKRQAIPRQLQFMVLMFLASAAVGVHLFIVSRLDFAYDEAGFVWRGKKYKREDIRRLDRSKWEKKGIVTLIVDEGTITLDAWHHTGVEAFYKSLPEVPMQTAS